MKKLVSVVSMIALISSLSACGNKVNDEIDITNITSTEVTTDTIDTEAFTTLIEETKDERIAKSEVGEIDKLYIIGHDVVRLPTTLNDMCEQFSFGLSPTFGETIVENELCHSGEMIAVAVSEKYEGVGDGDREAVIYDIYDFVEGAPIKEIYKGEGIERVISKMGEPTVITGHVYTFDYSGTKVEITVDDDSKVVSWNV